jgi:hypothetical protein
MIAFLIYAVCASALAFFVWSEPPRPATAVDPKAVPR